MVVRFFGARIFQWGDFNLEVEFRSGLFNDLRNLEYGKHFSELVENSVFSPFWGSFQREVNALQRIRKVDETAFLASRSVYCQRESQNSLDAESIDDRETRNR